MELSIDTTREAVDWVSTLLAATDYRGNISITNYAEPERADFTSLEVKPSPFLFTIRFYLPYDARVNACVDKIDHRLKPLHRTGMTSTLAVAVLEDKPTLVEGGNSLVHRIGQRFVVIGTDAPTHQNVADEITLSLGSSLSFGSGLHPATIGCLKLIERYTLPNFNVLDLGSGSGILSVAMAKLGARVLALDNDPIAVQATQDTVHLNQVEEQVTVKAGSLGQGSELGHWMGGDALDSVPTIKATGTFDLIVTNILARVHIALASDYQRALCRTDAQPGLLITAGFTTDYEDEVNQALTQAGFEFIDCERFNEWVVLAHRLKA
jgi:ribosomal protein L11 methyltransferase